MLDGMTEWAACNMLEEEKTAFVQSGSVNMNIRPFEIVTVKIHTV